MITVVMKSDVHEQTFWEIEPILAAQFPVVRSFISPPSPPL